MKTEHRHAIGGLLVEMRDSARHRWNAGKTTAYDLRSSFLHIPVPTNTTRKVTLRRAMNEKLEPDVAAQINGMPVEEVL